MIPFDYRAEHPEPDLVSRIEWLRELRPHFAKGSWKEGARLLQNGIRTNRRFGNEESAKAFVRAYLFEDLLENERYLEASALLWTGGMFEQRPAHITRIFNALRDYDLNILMGASGLSKTYSAAAYKAADYLRDPDNTSVKIASVNDTNLKGNLWSNMKVFLETALFDPDVKFNSTRMRAYVTTQRPECGVDAVLFSKATDSTGKIKGFHPKPFRLEPHPKYGDLTVVRILLDETQELPPGVESDLSSPKSTISEEGHQMKITLTCNPISETKWVVKLAAPAGGYDLDRHLDSLYDYDTPTGWHVTRLDGANFENVKYRRTIFPGFLSRKAYDGYMVAGQPTPNFYIFARGFPPPSQASETILPSTHFELARGEPMFTGLTQDVGGGDIAFIHDKGALAVGRYGVATGWIDWEGKEERFMSRRLTNEFETRHCVVLDDLIPLHGSENTTLADEIKDWCDRLGIPPEGLVVDKTGNGFGIWSHLAQHWGAGVVGVHWKESATPTKILAEDKAGADEQTRNKVSEMYWTVRRWMDPRVRGLFINPNCKHTELLKTQLTQRQWRFVGTAVEVESKESYIKRQGSSPDEADAFVQMVSGVRWRGFTLPAIVDEDAGTARDPRRDRKKEDKTSNVSIGLPSSNWINPHTVGAGWVDPNG